MREKKFKTIDGVIYIRGKCSCCKQCWIALGGLGKGKCMYGGPFAGYVKQEEEQESKDNNNVSK